MNLICYRSRLYVCFCIDPCNSNPGRPGRHLKGGRSVAMEVARCMISDNVIKEKHIPNFVNYIYVDGLKAIKPEAVNIIG